MSAQEAGAAKPAVPSSVTSPRAKLVYLYLDRVDAATAGEIADQLGLGKLAVYGVLRTLRERDVVERRDERFLLA